MSLRDELLAIGRRVMLAGLLALITGWILVLLAAEQFDLWPPLAATLAGAGLGVVLLVYQLRIYWPRLQAQLQRADVAEAPPQQRPHPIPAWVVVAWIGLLILIGWAGNSPFFPILAAGLLMGYGLSAPLLARRVGALERNRVVFYVEHSPGDNQRRLVRVIT